MMRLLLAGTPGAGQEIQAAELAGRGGALRISAENIFRVNVRDDTELGRVAELLHGRRRVPARRGHRRDGRGAVAECDARDGSIVDGYTRTLDQAGILDWLGTQLDCVLELVADAEQLIQRLRKGAEASGSSDDTDEGIRHLQGMHTSETTPRATCSTRVGFSPGGRRS